MLQAFAQLPKEEKPFFFLYFPTVFLPKLQKEEENREKQKFSLDNRQFLSYNNRAVMALNASWT